MKKTLEKLWNEYLAGESAAIESDEERELTKKAVELHERANSLLNEKARQAVEKYVDSLYEIEDRFVKKAFFKGCEFAVSFILEAGNFGKVDS